MNVCKKMCATPGGNSEQQGQGYVGEIQEWNKLNPHEINATKLSKESLSTTFVLSSSDSYTSMKDVD